MLGVNSPREPITPEFSREIRAALWRAITGKLTPEGKDAFLACLLLAEDEKSSQIFADSK